jgi:Uma2 family endonuclease
VIRLPWLDHPLTEQQVLDVFMLSLEDDTEDQPWMVMGDLQFWSASGFAHSLRTFARDRGLPWYVASMLPVLFRWPSVAGKKQLAPDTMVAFVPAHSRTSYDLDTEGSFPDFVLEVVSPSSTVRDQVEKRTAYEALGAREYALFTPHEDRPSLLEGYRRTAAGRFEPWPRDQEGRLWSEVLGLYLVPRSQLLYAATPDGQLLPNPDEAVLAARQAEAARRQAEEARRQEEEARHHAEEARRAAERERDHEAEARQRAEEEVERLRQELVRSRERRGDTGPG